jgi:hypothetical protein
VKLIPVNFPSRFSKVMVLADLPSHLLKLQVQVLAKLFLRPWVLVPPDLPSSFLELKQVLVNLPSSSSGLKRTLVRLLSSFSQVKLVLANFLSSSSKAELVLVDFPSSFSRVKLLLVNFPCGHSQLLLAASAQHFSKAQQVAFALKLSTMGQAIAPVSSAASQ